MYERQLEFTYSSVERKTNDVLLQIIVYESINITFIFFGDDIIAALLLLEVGNQPNTPRSFSPYHSYNYIVWVKAYYALLVYSEYLYH